MASTQPFDCFDAAPRRRGSRKLEPASQTNLAGIAGLLACPSCAATAVTPTDTDDALYCGQCELRFPVYASGAARIPWLFAEPMTTQLEWKARYHGFLHVNSLQLAKLRKARDEGRGTKTGRRRIDLQLQACERHRRQVSDILAPAELDGIDWPSDAANLLSGKLPRTQGLANYLDNIFRDWAWNNGENEILFATVERILGR